MKQRLLSPPTGYDTWPQRGRAGRRQLRRLTCGWGRGPGVGGPLRRKREDRLVGGLASGLAARTGFDVSLVRAVFVLATLATGFGVAAYIMGWLLVPAADSPTNIATRALADRRGIALASALGSLAVVLLLIAGILGAGWVFPLAWPSVISVVGITLIWRNASADEQATIRRLAEPVLGLAEGKSRRRSLLRVAAAAILLTLGLLALLGGHRSAVLRPLSGIVLLLAAILLVLGPWWLRIARDLVVERQARVRAEERADMAARVHDSVLQTLALIQKNADQPQHVIQLARAQERELRSWLFDGRAPGSIDSDCLTLAAGVRLIQQDVEVQHGIAVEAVTVGDCELDDDLAALLAAGREATVNAAKWSGAGVVSLFAEVEPTGVVLYVRDRGRGFDPAAVPADRKGLAESVQARMARHGGSVTVRSSPGEGTEVSLKMPRTAGRRQPSPA
ncbi:MAG TPA: PspC domain-containing protein [Streptosporangiaceae bacterium]|nr:PspC domain-containing protein [Streptosporangiaceae bacterium]